MFYLREFLYEIFTRVRVRPDRKINTFQLRREVLKNAFLQQNYKREIYFLTFWFNSLHFKSKINTHCFGKD